MTLSNNYSNYPKIVRQRASQLFKQIEDDKSINFLFPTPRIKIMFARSVCACGCGEKLSSHGANNRKFKQGHWTRIKWKLVYEQALKEYKNGILINK